MKTHTKLANAQDVFVDAGGYFGAGFNRRVGGYTYAECFRHEAERYNRDLQGGWQAAERLIEEGKIYYEHNFHHSHGGCPKGFAFQYGGRWVCNACERERVNRPWWAIKVFQDGNAWICVGEDFADLQESDNYAFGVTKDEAIASYGDLMLSRDAAILSTSAVSGGSGS